MRTPRASPRRFAFHQPCGWSWDELVNSDASLNSRIDELAACAGATSTRVGNLLTCRLEAHYRPAAPPAAVAGLHLPAAPSRMDGSKRRRWSGKHNQRSIPPAWFASFKRQPHHLQLERQALQGIPRGAPGGFEGRAIRLIGVPPPLLPPRSEKIPSNEEGPRRSRAAGPLSLNSRCYAISCSAPRRATRCCSCRESSRHR